jgi:hypothetical protein
MEKLNEEFKNIKKLEHFRKLQKYKDDHPEKNLKLTTYTVDLTDVMDEINEIITARLPKKDENN